MATFKNTVVNDTGFIGLPSGNTAQRPSSPANGYVRFNTSSNNIEYYALGTWVDAGPASNTFTVQYLVVAGGGGGGAAAGTTGNEACGGGGAGGLLSGNVSMTTGTYNITVGGGGAQYTQGANSTFDTLVAVGGGRGGYGFEATTLVGGNGGSGGGGRGWGSERAGGVGVYPGSTYLNQTRQGYDGGRGLWGNNPMYGGGGGGSGAAGANGGFNTGGTGGGGTASTITGSSVTYAGGGGGGLSTGGAGGGGNGATSSTGNGSNGTTNTGGGGGGGGQTSGTGGTGGSGIIVLKMPDTRTATFSAGITSSLATSGGFKIYSVTAGTGTVTIT